MRRPAELWSPQTRNQSLKYFNAYTVDNEIQILQSENFLKICSPFAPSRSRRLDWSRRLSERAWPYIFIYFRLNIWRTNHFVPCVHESIRDLAHEIGVTAAEKRVVNEKSERKSVSGVMSKPSKTCTLLTYLKYRANICYTNDIDPGLTWAHLHVRRMIQAGIWSGIAWSVKLGPVNGLIFRLYQWWKMCCDV